MSRSAELHSNFRRVARFLPWLGLAAFLLWNVRGFGGRPHAAFPVGSELPELTATLSDGSQFSSGDASGVVVLNFWASYCEPCRVEAPLLSAQAQAADVKVIGLSVEPLGMTDLSRLARRLGMHYPVGVADEALLSRFRVQSVPTTYVIAKNGKVVLSRVGVLGDRELEAALEAARDAS